MKKLTIQADIDDLWLMFGSALRYGLGRQTYVTHTIPKVIIDNLKLINEKWIDNLLRDLENYEKDRVTWQYGDSDYDYQNWMKLKEALLNELKIREAKNVKSNI